MLAASASGYTLHEWGTFTTVSGSDGIVLTGLEREEEPLPIFAYSHYGLENGNRARPDDRFKPLGTRAVMTKGIDLRRPVANVTVKMETPVIYFYSDQALDVSVKVGFEGGTISQWFPDRSAGELLPVPPPPVDPKKPRPLADWTLDFSKPYRGAIEWQAKVLSPEQSRDAILFKPTESLHWTRPRVPSANAVRTANGDTEGFLFYRGIGNFETGLVTKVGEDDTLRLQNKTGGVIPYALIYERHQGVIRWKSLTNLDAETAIPAGDLVKAAGSLEQPLYRDYLASFEKSGMPPEQVKALAEQFANASLPRETFAEPVYRDLVAGLEKAGLFREEAKAMVETWWDSYFATEGLRVFWIVPQEKTAAVLPLQVSPAPDKIVRVMVGRSEVLRPSWEREMLARAKSENPEVANGWKSFHDTDRFGIAYGHRMEALSRTASR